MLRRLYSRDHLDQVLATFALILIFNQSITILFGRQPLFVSIPPALDGSVTLLPGLVYPVYRLAIIAVGLAVALGLYLLINRTRIGMLVRAGATHREMVRALGVDIALLYTAVFGLGALLAGLAGLMAGPILAVQVGMGEQILIMTFVVVVIGGVGSVRGAFLGALIVGLVDTSLRAFLPGLLRQVMTGSEADALGAGLASMGIYLLMAIVCWSDPRDCSPPMSDAISPAQATTAEHRPRAAAPGPGAWPRRAALSRSGAGPAGTGAAGDPGSDLCHRRRQPQPGAGLRRHGLLRPCRLLRRRRLCRRHPLPHYVDDTLFLGLVPGTSQLLMALFAALLVCGLIAGLIGVLCLRTSGVQFIMITLAFAQMLFFLFVSLKAYGGDDGMTIRRRNELFGLNTRDDLTFYFICLSVAALVFLALWRIVGSRFGMVLAGIRQNERRMAAIGIACDRYKLAAFVISGMGTASPAR